MNHITKLYGSNAVLRDVSLKIRPGEIHALLGENGAGKSTLMNVLFGMPVIHSTGGFEGEVIFDGQKVSIASPMDAMAKGIGMVHQEFMLIPGFNVTDNIKLNREITKPWALSRILSKDLEFLDTESMARDARKALDDVGMSIEEYTLVSGLPVGHMQFIEIAREIDKSGMKLLVFDEPTAVLTESEAQQLLDVMKSIAAKGIAIIFITHRLDEVMNAADSVTILRDGQLVSSFAKADTTPEKLAALMIGRGTEGVIHVNQREEALKGDIAMTIRDLWVNMPGEVDKGINLDVREGEILGIGGLAGQGKIGVPNGNGSRRISIVPPSPGARRRIAGFARNPDLCFPATVSTARSATARSDRFVAARTNGASREDLDEKAVSIRGGGSVAADGSRRSSRTRLHASLPKTSAHFSSWTTHGTSANGTSTFSWFTHSRSLTGSRRTIPFEVGTVFIFVPGRTSMLTSTPLVARSARIVRMQPPG